MSEEDPQWVEEYPAMSEEDPQWMEECPAMSEEDPQWVEECPAMGEEDPQWVEECPAIHKVNRPFHFHPRVLAQVSSMHIEVEQFHGSSFIGSSYNF